MWSLSLVALLSASLSHAGPVAEVARTPPRGWNSYDSFTWLVNETQFLDNCQYMADNLLQHGYEYCVIDYLWYKLRDADDDLYDTWNIDSYGRPQPDVARWPSTAGGKGFRPIADKVHAMGLKFGFHIMMGTSSDAIKANSQVKGTSYTMQDIAGNDECPTNTGPTAPHRDSNCGCSWEGHSKDVNASHPGAQAYYASLYDMFINDWQVDFLKNDCIFAINYRPRQIKIQSQLIESSSRPVVYSLSPGGVGADFPWVTDFNDIDFAEDVHPEVNMYRITNDDWDTWADILPSHFDAAKNASHLIGKAGLNGMSWPDLDMLPLGYVTDEGSDRGPTHYCKLTHDEQYTQITLWAMARSPLFFGGDMRMMDNFTLSLITNEEVLAIDSSSSQNEQVAETATSRTWKALGADGVTVYAAVFNVGSQLATLSISFSDLGLASGVTCTIKDVWTQQQVGQATGTVSASVNSHGTRLLSLSKCA